MYRKATGDAGILVLRSNHVNYVGREKQVCFLVCKAWTWIYDICTYDIQVILQDKFWLIYHRGAIILGGHLLKGKWSASFRVKFCRKLVLGLHYMRITGWWLYNTKRGTTKFKCWPVVQVLFYSRNLILVCVYAVMPQWNGGLENSNCLAYFNNSCMSSTNSFSSLWPEI